ncbi:uncharacterized protein F4822DRAFT_100736 [Hypoxylon trugodes]|uniref:uncharacterized protein n=1 Tax=Hypoxylon trugodes TaxID=326681 RepID=UPI0021943CA3|nr:uncharacterized protein F4822DRAFT_100736 [Hypoxylon trugodes]KAI1382615.1 hypothetical protein F4822DRAFT_100736 [Hypoxylon trugodes]
MDERYTSISIPNHERLLRTEEDALILLVLALGDVCLRRGKISDVAGESKAQSHNHSQSTPNSPISPEEDRDGDIHASAGRHSSLPGATMREIPYPHSEVLDLGGMPNLDSLDYFTLAVGGRCQHQNVCNHVCIHLLAGLYYVSLGRLPESWSYIFLASQRIQAIVQRTFNKLLLSPMGNSYAGESTEDNQLIINFWTCLGLESDIRVTLPIPPSGLQQYEAKMPYPNLELATSRGVSQLVIGCYVAQLYLRKQLVSVHSPLKYTRCTNREDAIIELQGALKNSRDKWVPPSSQWKDGDPPPSDALSACLRARYWDIQVALYLPFLEVVLERKPTPPGLYRSILASNADSIMDSTTISFVKLAIEALFESIQAFRGLDKQHLIIFGLPRTAQTQCENLLVLAACSKNDILSRFIDRKILRALFKWVISLFQRIAYPTSALQAEMSSLIRLADYLDLMHGDK